MQVMVITYLGKQFFKITQGDLTLAFNPVSKDSKSGATARFGADIVMVSANHPDFNGSDQLSYGEKMPFVIDGPGDYEVKGIFIHGAMSKSVMKGRDYINTVYSLSLDNTNLVFLGALSDSELSKEAREIAESPDILFLPVGGGDTLDAKTAAKLAASLEAKTVIPMDYDQASLKVFLKEMGEEKAEVTEKLTVKKKDLEGNEGRVIVLKKA